jgi:hypothetical protein
MSRRAWLWIVQGGAAAIVIAFLGRALARHWADFRSLDLHIDLRPGWLALSVLAVFATYALQVWSWTRVLRGWGQRLRFGTAARVWCLSNLGRYIPGKVWSVAGLVLLAQREGVAPWAAAASAVAVQALGIGTAVALVAATAPAAASPLRLTAAAVAAAAMLAVLAWPWAIHRLGVLVRAATPWRAMPATTAVQGAVLTLASWASYGGAFWLLGRALSVAGTLNGPTAAGVFALGYILGLAALFAPGGVVVREVALVALLAPIVGTGSAVALSLASRVQLTLTEAAAALLALAIERRLQGGRG